MIPAYWSIRTQVVERTRPRPTPTSLQAMESRCCPASRADPGSRGAPPSILLHQAPPFGTFAGENQREQSMEDLNGDLRMSFPLRLWYVGYPGRQHCLDLADDRLVQLTGCPGEVR